ncbi:malto-oligosyltrehalose trehalohydrolase [Naumannella halotolerans]|uniref:Malto-oligosyltrehalose trehalohydrolase n=1 Tax=Naumannella halotolerans TaxID=993414 RepID=A0A4R7JA20_9ACTN|nr:malto-oligosyltrehalose trehalohydrolase [Naumannella halotolerans]TDT34402.1 maltooligosyltrehalose trehalohydrolase [Naumannella halotolerans]
MISYDVWAPAADRVRLLADGQLYAMERTDDGWWHPLDLPTELYRPDIDYGYLLGDDDHPLPDPRSRRQPHGVHALSRTVDLTALRTESDWTGRQLAGSVIYELHIGTFTEAGTLDAAIGKLDHLVSLGIDFVEPMPVNAFNGDHGWGYDGVAWYAVHEAYGGPEAYRRFVDACHARGLGVIQDVVYNHLGPSGNYLPRFGPYLIEEAQTPWGSQLNLDGPESDEVRRYIIDNALGWFDDYGVDGLRLDAVHALVDHRAKHLLAELAERTDRLSAHLRRPLTLIAESDRNDPLTITSREAGGLGLAGQWSDDFHHALVTNLSGDTSGYFADFAGLGSLAKVIDQGFFHDGGYSGFRKRHHGQPINTALVPANRLVICAANHDQIGNRASGDRPRTRLDQRQLVIAAVITVLANQTPMIFAGEEWGASTPFAYFTSHPETELGEAVSRGRIGEFEAMGWDLSVIPDPQQRSTFENSKLDWAEPGAGEFAELLAVHTELLAIRRRYSAITDPAFTASEVDFDAEAGWLRIRRGNMVIAVNFGELTTLVPGGTEGGYDDAELIFAHGDVEVAESLALGPHSSAVLLLS